MTCIVGVEHEGVVYIGGDSALSDASTGVIRTLTHPKVFVKEDMVFGCCSDLRAAQLLQYALEIPPQEDGVDDMAYLVTSFMDAFRAAQKKKGTLKTSDGETQEMQFLMGYRGCLYTVEENFQVYRTPDGWASVGSGSDIANGAMYVTSKSKTTPQKRLRLALEAAEAFNNQVRRPFHIVTLKSGEQA